MCESPSEFEAWEVLEGKKPDKVISAKLNVGGKLLVNASNGDTKVFFNGREITKEELKVLKLANVQCPCGTHFWLYEDGSYEEEGQNNIKGNIWGKAFSRLMFSLYSLPVPAGNSHGQKETQTTFSGRSLPVYSEQGKIQKLLLVGLEGSGTSTIFKQVKFINGGKFSTEELQAIKICIRSNLYRYLTVLLEGREQFEEDALCASQTSCLVTEIDAPSMHSCSDKDVLNAKRGGSYAMNKRLKDFSDRMLDVITTHDTENFLQVGACEYASIVGEIWRHPSIQETYRRREELQCLPDTAKYFLNRSLEISSNEYRPSEEDILYAEGVTPTNGLTFFDFTSDNHSLTSETKAENSKDQPPLTKYQLIRIGSKRLLTGCKWLDMLQNFNIVVFCVALSDYDQVLVNDTGALQNRMLASRDLFENLVRHPSFEETNFVLLMNKYDVFEEKIKLVPLTACEWFHDFSPLVSKSHRSMTHQAYFYIAVKFKELYTAITGRKLFVWRSRARDRGSVDEAFRYIQEIIKWDEEKDGGMYAIPDYDSFCSRKSSSFYVRQQSRNFRTSSKRDVLNPCCKS